VPKLHIDTYDFAYLKESTIGQRLRFFRNQISQYSENPGKYTTTSLGDRLNISPQTISSIERGDSKNPSLLVVHKLTKEYGVPLTSVLDEFYQGEEKLFSIGKPDVITVDVDTFDALWNASDLEVVNKKEDNINLSTDKDDVGLLLYKKQSEDLIQPLLYQNFKHSLTEDELLRLIARLMFESSLTIEEPQSEYKTSHPFEQARRVIENNPDSLTSHQLIDLIMNKKDKE